MALQGAVAEIVLEPYPAGGWHGRCTGCGWPMHRWDRQKAEEGAQRHLGKHSGPAMRTAPGSPGPYPERKKATR